jgi:hypothetical protein
MPRIARRSRKTGEVRWFDISDKLISRVWSYVDERGPDDCWPWTRSRYATGYGQIRVGGADGSVFEASRVVFAIVNGEAGPEIDVRHACDNPPCCNPRHLLSGTTRDNILDAIERGRMTWPPAATVERTCPVCARRFTTRLWTSRKLCGRDSCWRIVKRRTLERQGRNPDGTFGRPQG